MSSEKKKLSLPVQLLIAMLFGIGAGFLLGEKASYISFIGSIFMRLLKMCVYPLILVSIITGVANVMDIARLKKIGLSFLGYTFISSTCAAIFGVIAMVVTKAGQGVNLGDAVTETASVDVVQSFVEWIPDNVFASFSNGSLIQIIIFAVAFGAVLASVRKTETGAALFKILVGVNDVMTKMVGFVIRLAPIGVFALIANMIGTTKLEVVSGVAKMLGAYYAGLLAFLVLFIPIVLKVFAKVSPIQFYKNAFPTMVMAASTCSSVGTLPVTMKTAKERCGVPDDIVNLVTAPAATINMDGAAVEYTCYVLFAAYAFNVHLSRFRLSLRLSCAW
ncbi:MAG: dicarboxylate/amino acid:cation symporter [Lachnospiraceae bacterium]|nr:dicarboxylate/amino acid:cation symporter [Lachnospiraceae bacterium]